MDLIDGKNLKEETEFYTDLCTSYQLQNIADMRVTLKCRYVYQQNGILMVLIMSLAYITALDLINLFSQINIWFAIANGLHQSTFASYNVRVEST